MSHRGQIICRVGQEHRQALVGLVKQASTMTSAWRIWDDLMFMASASLSQPFTPMYHLHGFQWRRQRENVAKELDMS